MSPSRQITGNADLDVLKSKMTELLSIRKHDSTAQYGTHPQVPGNGPVSRDSKGNDIAVNLEKVSNGKNGFHSRRPPINLQWQNITLSTEDGKPILKGVSGSANAGELTTIMGPSGAGKSTLLNVLSGFRRSKGNGCITINGAPLTRQVSLSCYIMQDDHVLPHLTVRESIQLAARLKIPSSVSKQDREKAVEECIEALGLKEQQHNRANQLSGGQRKRLCIAQEIVSNPCLIFLDEPTSGLDSSSCLQCIRLLKSLAEEGRTVICTIHQPSARIFELFDKLYMMAEGDCIYRGPTSNLVPFLSKQGLSCPTYHNPADFMIEVASGEYGDWVFKLKTVVNTCDHHSGVLSMSCESSNFDGRSEVGCQVSTLNLLEDNMKNKSPHRKDSSFESHFRDYATSSWNQFKVLTYRSLICLIREPMATHVRLFANVVIGILIGTLYYDIGNDATKIYSNSGLLFFSLMVILYTAIMPTLLTFPLEKTIFAREHINSWYSSGMYYLSKTCAEIPFQIVLPTIYCSIVYWMTSQPNDLGRFGIFILSSIMVSLVAQSMGFLLGAATSVQNAVFLGPVASIPFLLFSGFFISLDTIPSYLQWLTYISYTRFCFHSMLFGIYGMDRPELICKEEPCPFKEPQEFLRELGMDDGNIYVDFAAAWASFFVFRVISYYVLFFRVIYKR